MHHHVDAITNDPIGKKSVTVPVGILGDVLHYNTSTLIRIAREFGLFLQPPYFREPMKDDLLSQITAIEGPDVISRLNLQPQAKEALLYRTSHVGQIGHNLHGFTDFMSTHHEPLSPKNLYYCPICYDACKSDYLKRTHSSMEKSENKFLETTSAEIPNKEKENVFIDPLNIISRLEATNEVSSFVFQNAKLWKSHIYEHHYLEYLAHSKPVGVTERSATFFSSRQLLAQDYTIRMLINGYVGSYNRFLGTKRMFHKLHGTTKQYWHCDAHFNVHRYNRLVDHISCQSEDGTRSMCKGDPKRIIILSDDAAGESSQDEDESEGESSNSEEQCGYLIGGNFSQEYDEEKELIRIAQSYSRRAKRQAQSESEEIDASSQNEFSTEDSYLSCGSNEADPSDPRALTEYERNQLERMALKQDVGSQSSPYRAELDNRCSQRKLNLSYDQNTSLSGESDCATSDNAETPLPKKEKRILLYDTE